MIITQSALHLIHYYWAKPNPRSPPSPSKKNMLGRFVASSSTVRTGKCIFCRRILMKLKMKNWNLTFSLFLKTSEVNRFGRSEEAMMVRFSDMLVHHRVAARVLVLTGLLVSIGHLSQSTNPPNIPFRNKWGVTFQEGLNFLISG